MNLRGHGPFVFVEDLDHPELTPSDRHHLSRALRLRDREPLVVADGRGRWRQARFGAAVGVDGDVVMEPAASPELTVVFAPVKGDRPEWLVQKLTEIGVDRMIPLVADRSVVRWEGSRAESALQRLRRVAREAAMQSRRAWLPRIEEPIDFTAAMALDGACVAAAGGSPPTLSRPVVVVGPEGGWTAEELGAAPATVGLGRQVLRAETAALVAATLLVACREKLLA